MLRDRLASDEQKTVTRQLAAAAQAVCQEAVGDLRTDALYIDRPLCRNGRLVIPTESVTVRKFSNEMLGEQTTGASD
jgi:hypothetical protein